MSRGPGRPPLPEDQKVRTRMVRVYEAMYEKLRWIVRLDPSVENSAALLDDLAGDQIDALYAPLADRVATIKAAEAGDAAPVLTNSLESE